MTDIFEYLRNNAYPGRGIMVGEHGGETVLVYFIMGRSVNSRNRVFRKKDNIIYTEAYDPSKLSDPSLIIYNAVREFEGNIIVTNGDQTDTIYEYLSEGKSFREALDTREYEPDAPNYTPRISALIGNCVHQIAILKEREGECLREYYSYEPAEGTGRFISTYDGDGDPLPSFSKRPLEFAIDHEFETFAGKLWTSLDPENKVSLYVRFGDRDIIFNRNEEMI